MPEQEPSSLKEEKEIQREDLREKERLPENIVIVETPEARFRIIYGKHIKLQHPKDFGSAEALVLETGDEDCSQKEVAEELMREFYSIKGTQYPLIIHEAREKNRPIFFVDVSKALKIQLSQTILKAFEMGFGTFLIFSLCKDIAEDINKDKKITRRDFLKKAQRLPLVYILVVRLFLIFWIFWEAQAKDLGVGRQTVFLGRLMRQFTQKLKL